MKNKQDSKFYQLLYRMFESRDFRDPIAFITDVLYALIIINSLVFTILEITSVWEEHEQIFKIFEYVMIGFFAIEWIADFMIVDIVHPELPWFKRKLKWVLSIESIVDIICLIVFLLTLFLEPYFKNIVFLEFITLIKCVRIYKLIKYIAYIPHHKKHEEENIEK